MADLKKTIFQEDYLVEIARRKNGAPGRPAWGACAGTSPFVTAYPDMTLVPWYRILIPWYVVPAGTYQVPGTGTSTRYCPIEQNENFDRAKKKFFGIARSGHKGKSENKKSKSVGLCGI